MQKSNQYHKNLNPNIRHAERTFIDAFSQILQSLTYQTLNYIHTQTRQQASQFPLHESKKEFSLRTPPA